MAMQLNLSYRDLASQCVSEATVTAFGFVFSKAGLLKMPSSFQLGACLFLVRNELVFIDNGP